jgi:integrase
MRRTVIGFKYVSDTDSHLQNKARLCLNILKENPEKTYSMDELITGMGYIYGKANKKAAQVVLYRLKRKGLITSVLDVKECPASKEKRLQVESSPAMKSWLKRLKSEETKEKFLYLFLKYFQWVQSQGKFKTPDELIEHKQMAQNDKTRYSHIDMIEDYLSEVALSAGQKKSSYTAIRSFYKHNKAELPSYPLQFTDKTLKAIVSQQPITLDEVRQVLTNAKPREKAMFLCMLQTGMDRSTFAEYFNLHCWSEITRQLGNENPELWDLSKAPIRINLFRIKTQVSHHSYLSLDALKALQSWLHIRQTLTNEPMRAEQPLFLSPQRNPVKKESISVLFNKLAISAGLESRKYGKSSEIRYRFHVHEMRDTFRTACTVSGLDHPVAEYFIGHSMDKLGYDKSPEVYPEHYRQQYMKVEGMLNIFSNQAVGIKKFEELESKLGEKEAVINSLIENGHQKASEMEAQNVRITKLEAKLSNMAAEEYLGKTDVPKGLEEAMESNNTQEVLRMLAVENQQLKEYIKKKLSEAE